MLGLPFPVETVKKLIAYTILACCHSSFECCLTPSPRDLALQVHSAVLAREGLMVHGAVSVKIDDAGGDETGVVLRFCGHTIGA